MEDPFYPRDPQHRLYMSPGEGTCRVEELACILRDSTQITPSGFTWIKPSELCHSLLRQHHDSQQFVVVDTRTEEEAVGGCVCGAIRSSTNLSQSEIEQLVVHYRAGRRIIFYCLRSQSRAPLAAQKLLQVIDAQVGRGAAQEERFDERVCVLQGGFAGLLQEVVSGMAGMEHQVMVSLHEVDHKVPRTVVTDLEADKWALSPSPGGPALAHISEVQNWQTSNVTQGRQVEQLMQEEVSQELAYLVDQRMSLSPPAAGSMPYIS
eukprot:Tamp_13043.p1 GENE.Tamp_13043~~Tamp_13043.p1  ORF type:complete len:302 (-),score=57.89 Tamp_13043:849-1640(-)